MCNYPNLWIPERTLAVLKAAEVVGRERPYNSDAPGVLHVESDTLLGTVCTFYVVNGLNARQYWVTRAGFIGVKKQGQEHLAFLNLNECDASELDGIFAELQRLATQPAHT